MAPIPAVTRRRPKASRDSRMATTCPSDRPSRGEFADDQAVTALEDAHQLVEPAAPFESLSGGGRLDVDALGSQGVALQAPVSFT